MTRFDDLAPEEKLLTGAFELKHGELLADKIQRRIDWLISNRLDLIATSADGWTSYYRDPGDRRIWKLAFSDASAHGGGPNTLEHSAEPDHLPFVGNEER